MADAIDLPSRPPARIAAVSTARPIGRRRFIAGAGASCAARRCGRTTGAGRLGQRSPAGRSEQVFILPSAIRLADTREPWNYEYLTVGDGYIRVKVGGRNGVPATATAAVLTVTSVNSITQPRHAGRQVSQAGRVEPQPRSRGPTAPTW
ncbi:MAG: hypothetical protein R2705_21030 [Ilumatobacteraceae bacterium]